MGFESQRNKSYFGSKGGRGSNRGTSHRDSPTGPVPVPVKDDVVVGAEGRWKDSEDEVGHRRRDGPDGPESERVAEDRTY